MGRLMSAIIGISAVAGIYIAFKPQIDTAWAQVVSGIKSGGIFGPQLGKIVLTAPTTFQGSSVDVSIQTLDKQGNALPNIPISIVATPSSADPLLVPGNLTTDTKGQGSFTLESQLSTFSGPITVVASNGSVSSNSLIITFLGQNQTNPGPGKTNSPGPTTTPPATTPVILNASLSFSPNTINDGQSTRISWQLQGGNDSFTGSIDTGNGTLPLLNADILRGYIDFQYNVNNLVQKQFAPKLVITDTVTKFVYTAVGSITVNPLPPPPPCTGCIPAQVIIYNQPRPGFWSVDITYSNGVVKSYTATATGTNTGLSTQNVQSLINQGASVEDLSGQWGTAPVVPQTNILLTIAGTISQPPDLEVDINVENNANTSNIITLQIQIIDQAGNTVGFPSLSNLTLNPNANITFRLSTQLASTVKTGDSLSVKVMALAAGSLAQAATPVSEVITA